MIALLTLSLISILLIIAHILTRNSKTTAKRTIHKVTTTSLILLPLLTIPTIAIISNTHPNAQATSNLSSVTPAIDINIYKDTLTGPTTKTANSTTTVTTDNYSGYTLSAKLNQTPAINTTNNITLTLNNEKLTENSINIYTNETNTSPSTQDHTIAVTVPQDIQSGTYKYNITYDVIDNPSTTMQSMTKAKCDALTLNETITLRDARDNQEYRMRKLADNNCWMVDNLRLELIDGMQLTPDDTNVPETKTVALASGGRANGSNFTSSGYLTIDNTNKYSPNYINYNAWRQVKPDDPNMSNTTKCRTDDGSTYNVDSKTGCGYLYNFYTATASTTDNTKNINYYPAKDSICPSGWKLPTGLLALSDKTNDFAKLDLAYAGGNGGSHNLANPDTQNLWLSTGVWQGTFGGDYISSLRDQGSFGRYWSSSVVSASNAYSAYFYGSGVNSGSGSYGRHYGYAVRCLVI
jgi:uncharacterized protein (TIGR02145 family)